MTGWYPRMHIFISKPSNRYNKAILMKRFAVGIIFTALLVAAFVTAPLFFATENVEAGSTKITWITEMYSCNLVNGTSCTEGTYHYTEVEESTGHWLFGSHRHGTEHVYVTRETVDTVEACGNCLGPGG